MVISDTQKPHPPALVVRDSQSVKNLKPVLYTGHQGANPVATERPQAYRRLHLHLWKHFSDVYELSPSFWVIQSHHITERRIIRHILILWLIFIQLVASILCRKTLKAEVIQSLRTSLPLFTIKIHFLSAAQQSKEKILASGV